MLRLEIVHFPKDFIHVVELGRRVAGFGRWPALFASEFSAIDEFPLAGANGDGSCAPVG